MHARSHETTVPPGYAHAIINGKDEHESSADRTMKKGASE
jgi:hypothetical protein